MVDIFGLKNKAKPQIKKEPGKFTRKEHLRPWDNNLMLNDNSSLGKSGNERPDVVKTTTQDTTDIILQEAKSQDMNTAETKKIVYVSAESDDFELSDLQKKVLSFLYSNTLASSTQTKKIRMGEIAENCGASILTTKLIIKRLKDKSAIKTLESKSGTKGWVKYELIKLITETGKTQNE
jgi:hypothetical protein